ncbi:hypothetical protein F8G81_03025 [Arthrobacter sp. CDRTa11]|uniref:hypothetical protein n=1 Tax=Arthrobacter sp. CDRTa11 TaxID=2651199 RepID=UPI0022659504|nr:hypothetical protein [Arthrobacter sp. CDRTa11]UZX01706.1 hypothetical protein F8G81_03025 [Arthrobacter sp. CDRTa11]
MTAGTGSPSDPDGVDSGSWDGTGAQVLAAARLRLAASQRELVEALVAKGPVPEGFDPLQVAAVRRGLERKRLGGIGYHFPALAGAIRANPGLMELFGSWHSANHPGEGPEPGYYADGVRLIGFLEGIGRLPGDATREVLMLRIGTSAAPDGHRIPARWAGLRRVGVDGKTWWVAGSHRRWVWLRSPRCP